jgi:Ca-activated chloride channel family protein
MNEETSMLLTSTNGEPLLLQGVRATGRLEDTLLSMNIEQRYLNATQAHIEAVYTFPLPWGSVLMGVEVVLGGKTLSGQVTARNQAEQRYEQALSHGDAAILLERNRDGSHTLNLGNLAPGEDCVIRVRYAQSIGIEQGSVRLALPTVMAPRFGDPAKAGLQPQQVPESDLMVEYPFDLTVDVFGSLASARVASPTHPISVGPLRESARAGVRIGLSRSAWLDRDVVLVFDELAHESLGQTADDPFVPGQLAVKLALKPRVPQRASPLVLKVLVDCSGSMQGDSIASARGALQAIAQKLQEGDSFSLSRFGDRVLHRSRALWAVTPATQLGAQRWISQLQADLGGTEMEGALASTFALASAQQNGADGRDTHPAQIADVLLVTDGEIYEVTQTVQMARASGHRVFVVGIGSAANQALIRELAQATGGACEFVAPGEAVEPAVLRMFGRLRGGRLSRLSLAWPDAIEPVWQQDLPLGVFDGDTVHVHAVLDRAPGRWVEGKVVLSAEVDTVAQDSMHPRATVAAVSLARVDTTKLSGASAEEASTLARMVAWARTQALGQAAEAETAQASRERASKIAELAVMYQLVTTESSLVLVRERAPADKAVDMPAQVKVRQMLAAGWAGTGSVGGAGAAAADLDSLCRSRVDVEDYGDMSFDGLDLPVFSRTNVTRSPPLTRSSKSRIRLSITDEFLDWGEPPALVGHWMSDAVYEGLTPLGLSAWLGKHPAEQWPTDSQGLDAMGLGQAVIDWIEFVLGPKLVQEGVTGNAVTLFLRWMATQTVHQALAQSMKGRVRSVIQNLLSMRTAASPAESAAFSVIAEVLVGMTGDAWPDQLFLLGSGSTCTPTE